MKTQPPAERNRLKQPRVVGNPPIAQGSPGGTERSDMALPHEHDESTANETPHEPQDVIRQAKDDLDAGQVDTDLRATPGLDARRRDALLRRQR
jgi:hypothetical protein